MPFTAEKLFSVRTGVENLKGNQLTQVHVANGCCQLLLKQLQRK